MIVLMELAGILAIGVFAWAIYRASRARPEDAGLRWTARIAVVAWIVFLAMWVINMDAIRDDPVGTLINLLIAAVILAVVMGYRTILGKLKDRAGQ